MWFGYLTSRFTTIVPLFSWNDWHEGMILCSCVTVVVWLSNGLIFIEFGYLTSTFTTIVPLFSWHDSVSLWLCGCPMV